MSDSVITLSDSNESLSSVEIDPPQNKPQGNWDEGNSELDFPEVHFDYLSHVDGPANYEHLNADTRINRSPDALQTNSIKQNERTGDAGFKRNEEAKGKVSKKSKATLPEGRLQKEKESSRNKALKAIAAKKLRDMKPGECLKFMEVTLDVGIRNLGLTADITGALQNSNLRFQISTQLIPNSITWKREMEESYVDETNNVCTVKKTEEVDRIIVIWDCEETVRKVEDQTVLSSISSIKELVPKCIINLVVYGMQNYFPSKGKGRKTNKKHNSNTKNAPHVTWKQLEMCLAEIQILENCSSRLIDNPQELALMICQYSKSIAEIPFKKEQHKNWKDKFDWYVTGDNRDTIRVDKDGNGLKRLWEQQLQLFNASSLEVAQTISSLYPSPTSLMEAYARCTESEGMNLLKDIPIRRAAGPLTAARKIGIELSKKIYLTFTSTDGDAVLR